MQSSSSIQFIISDHHHQDPSQTEKPRLQTYTINFLADKSHPQLIHNSSTTDLQLIQNGALALNPKGLWARRPPRHGPRNGRSNPNQKRSREQAKTVDVRW